MKTILSFSFGIIIYCSMSSCNKLLYETPMPQIATIVDSFSDEMLGQYLMFGFTHNSLETHRLTISKRNNLEYTVSSRELGFLDSATCVAQGIDSITNVTIENAHIQIETASQIHQKSFLDTISSDSSFYYYTIDLRKHYFEDMLFGKGKKHRCQLRFDGKSYYLNINYFDKYWLVSSIKMVKNQLEIIKMHMYLEGDSDIVKQIATKYKLDSLTLPSRKQHFLLQSDDQEMKSLLHEDFLPKEIWYKITP